ncbi:MAG: hypothetical protein M1134_05150 [Actinobacteria bacterium]|nr:hypothetical protein [Actinomycetota bacterium]MCL5445237.1 hypothetical protein [Actinomycetota bacterium]
MKPLYENPGKNVSAFKEAFEAEGVDWALIGGLAAIEHRATGRETVDVDFVVSSLASLERRLERMQLARVRVLEEPEGSPYLVQGETADGMHFDIYVASIDFENAVLATKDDKHVASAEAVILYKLMAMRREDVDDVRSILDNHPGLKGLDVEFIERWAAELDVQDEWHGFVAEYQKAKNIRSQLILPASDTGDQANTPKTRYVKKQGVDTLGRRYTRWIRQA